MDSNALAIVISSSQPAGAISAIAISDRVVEQAESEVGSKIRFNVETGIHGAKEKLLI